MCVLEKVKTITFFDEIKGNVLMIFFFLKTGRAEVLNILFYSEKKGSPNLRCFELYPGSKTDNAMTHVMSFDDKQKSCITAEK